MGTGTGNNTISVATVLADSLTAIVNNVSASSGSGSLNLTAAISGPGGFTKQGDGLVTLGNGAKAYQGPTILQGGRTRISVAAQPSATSSFTINAGAQLTLITTGTGSFTFGAGPLNLNGSGAITGPFAAFPGAIRNNTDFAATIGNPVVLQSDTLLHVEGAASGSLTFTNVVSGSGSLTLTAPSSSANQGQLVLNGANTYAGGTFVNGGTLVARGATATFGLGNVIADNALAPDANAKLTIESGVLNAIADSATLTLAGGRDPNTADTGIAELGAGVNESVAALARRRSASIRHLRQHREHRVIQGRRILRRNRDDHRDSRARDGCAPARRLRAAARPAPPCPAPGLKTRDLKGAPAFACCVAMRQA